MNASPTVLMAMWAAGLAAGGVVVGRWRVVGHGYTWLTGAVVTLVGVGLAVVTGSPLAWLGTALAATAALVASRPLAAVGAFGITAALFISVGLEDSTVLPLVSGAVLLGGVTTEMMLGHWFLIDPQLPRWSLSRLALFGVVGLGLDLAVLLFDGLLAAASRDPILGWAYLALTVMTALLMVGVVFSLKEPSYTGVMAATGLSYLAVLTAFGVAVVGRMLVA